MAVCRGAIPSHWLTCSPVLWPFTQASLQMMRDFICSQGHGCTGPSPRLVWTKYNGYKPKGCQSRSPFSQTYLTRTIHQPGLPPDLSVWPNLRQTPLKRTNPQLRFLFCAHLVFLSCPHVLVLLKDLSLLWLPAVSHPRSSSDYVWGGLTYIHYVHWAHRAQIHGGQKSWNFLYNKAHKAADSGCSAIISI